VLSRVLPLDVDVLVFAERGANDTRSSQSPLVSRTTAGSGRRHRYTRAMQARAEATHTGQRWRGTRGGGAALGMDRLLLRAVLAIAPLLALVLLVGAARRVLDLPAVTPAVAIGTVWLVGLVAILGWIGLVAASAYRERGTGR
jgi:hypothetical protein